MSRPSQRSSGRLRWEVWAFLAAYLAGLVWASRGITVDFFDGQRAIMNSLLVAGVAAPGTSPGTILDVQRPPLGWLAFTPFVAGAYRAAGAQAAFKVCHAIMPCFLAALLGSYCLLYSRLFSREVSFLLLVLIAANPLLIQYSPFAVLDIFSALAVLPFLWAAFRYLEKPGVGRYVLLLAAYIAAFLSKYHLGLLILAPLSYRFLDPAIRGVALRTRFKRVLDWRLGLLPLLCYASAVVFWALLFWRASTGGLFRSHLMFAHHQLWGDYTLNVFSLEPPLRYAYARSFWSQMGPGLLVVVFLGLWLWLRDRRPLQTYLLWSLLSVMAAVHCIHYKEQRYIIPLAPLAYVAVGYGAEGLLSRLRGFPGQAWSRYAVMLAMVILVPWRSTAASLRYIGRDPTLHTMAPWRLGRIIEQGAPSGCVAWAPGEMAWRQDDVYQIAGEHQPRVSDATVRLFTPGMLNVLRVDGGTGGCRPDLVIVPDLGRSSPRWEGGPLAKVYRAPGGPAALAELAAGGHDPRGPRWEVYLEGTRGIGGRP